MAKKKEAKKAKEKKVSELRVFHITHINGQLKTENLVIATKKKLAKAAVSSQYGTGKIVTSRVKVLKSYVQILKQDAAPEIKS